MHKISKLTKKDFSKLLSYTKRDELLLPSSDDPMTTTVLFNEKDLLDWKKSFIKKHGKEGILVFEKSSFNIIQNTNYTEWYNKMIEGVYNWTKKYGSE